MTWRILLRHFATRQKVAGSIPDGATGIFIDIILPVVRTQHLTEMTDKDICLGVKAAGA